MTFDEIVQCCNRNIARRKLQTYPTDIYATYQLGYVGTEEDYNFLLSILEDNYSSSSFSHGNNGERVWMCVRAISNLSFCYRRKDAIPFLIEVCKHIKNKKVLEMVQDCCESLKECNSFSERQYRVDLLVRTDKVVHIYANSKEKWIAKIDGTLGYDERIDWCYLRSSAKQIKLIFETPLGNKEVMIDMGDNNPQYRQVIDIETPVFSRDMAKRILDARGDRVLVIPEGITKLAYDFALQFDEHNNKYYFFQIDIPASVSKIDSIILTEKPCWASDDRLECFDEINVADDNLAFCSIDGVLFSKDMKILICYPCGKQEEIYAIPNGVEIIAPNAFNDNHFLKSISLPPSLIKIDSMAFDSCENLNCVNFSEGLEVIADNAFIFCDVTHMILPNSLRRIHWTNLIGIGVGIRNIEVPNSKIDIDMTDYHECNQGFYMPPLLLIQANQTFEKFARRYKMNSVKGYYIDESGIIWSEDGSTIIEFPVEWYDEEYLLPKKTTGIFRWAFNCSSVKRVIASKTPQLVGRTQGDDFSRLDIDSDGRYDAEFLVINSSNNETVSAPLMLDIQEEHRKGEKGMKICVPHFKIGITFSGKYRKQFVEPLCDELLKLGYNKDDIFYDSWHDVLINGVHGDSILRQIYFKNCDCVVVLLSPDYKEKNWTGHIEWSAVKELINTGYDNKICLLRVDSADIGKIDGLYKNQTIAKTIDGMSAVEIAAFVHQKYKMLI
ncbi:MAG: leucine-rich repeat protein [Ruminococcus sp.]|nr:leucine-rich repeat protein [Ruminococcus sp.]